MGALPTVRAQSDKILIGYWPIASGLPLYAGLERGFFKEAGLNVEGVKFQSAQQVAEAMIAGRIHGSAIAIVIGLVLAWGNTGLPLEFSQLAEHTTEHVRLSLPKIYSRELVDVIFEQPYCRIGNLVDKQIGQRQAASRYLKELVALGVLREMTFGKEKLFIHPKLMQLLTRDSNAFVPYT